MLSRLALTVGEVSKGGSKDQTDHDPTEQPAMPSRNSRLNEVLCSLAVGQLQMQTSRSGALDAGALGVMAVDAALAAIVIDHGAIRSLGIAALVMLGLSLGLAARSLLLPDARGIGPTISAARRSRTAESDVAVEESLLDDLAEKITINEQALIAKAPLCDWALRLLLLAIAMALVGRL